MKKILLSLVSLLLVGCTTDTTSSIAIQIPLDTECNENKLEEISVIILDDLSVENSTITIINQDMVTDYYSLRESMYKESKVNLVFKERTAISEKEGHTLYYIYENPDDYLKKNDEVLLSGFFIEDGIFEICNVKRIK